MFETSARVCCVALENIEQRRRSRRGGSVRVALMCACMIHYVRAIFAHVIWRKTITSPVPQQRYFVEHRRIHRLRGHFKIKQIRIFRRTVSFMIFPLLL